MGGAARSNRIYDLTVRAAPHAGAARPAPTRSDIVEVVEIETSEWSSSSWELAPR